MGKTTHYSKILFLIITIIFLGLTLFSASTDAKAAGPSNQYSLAVAGEPSFVVTTQNNLISVKATDASLKDVIERIGRELGIAVYAHVSEDEKVTMEFHDLSLEDALRHLSGNYAYTSDKTGEKVSGIYLYPKGNQDHLSPLGESEQADSESLKNQQTERRAGSSEPFKFEFDPKDFMEEKN